MAIVNITYLISDFTLIEQVQYNKKLSPTKYLLRYKNKYLDFITVFPPKVPILSTKYCLVLANIDMIALKLNGYFQSIIVGGGIETERQRHTHREYVCVSLCMCLLNSLYQN